MIYDGDIIIADKGELIGRNARLSYKDYNLLAVTILAVVCYVSGLIATSTPIQALSARGDRFFAENLPRNRAMMLTIPFVLYGLFRYLYLVHREGGGGNPTATLLRDRASLINGVLYVVVVLLVLRGSTG